MSKYEEWNSKGFAEIISLENLRYRVPSYDCTILTSGGFDPIHPGHISVILTGKSLVAEYAQQNIRAANIVVVNGDSFLRRKKGKPFQDLQTRCLIAAAISGVDFVVPFESESDTVCEPIEILKPTIFLKGGDRNRKNNIPEWDICQKVGTRILSSVGFPKNWSSSHFLEDWAYYINGRVEGPRRSDT